MWKVCGVLLALIVLALTVLCVIRWRGTQLAPATGGEQPVAARSMAPEEENTPIILPAETAVPEQTDTPEPAVSEQAYERELTRAVPEWEKAVELLIQSPEAKRQIAVEKGQERRMENEAGEFLLVEPGRVSYVGNKAVYEYHQLFLDVTWGFRYMPPSAALKPIEAYAKKGMEQELPGFDREQAIKTAEELTNQLLGDSLFEARAEKVTVFSMQQMRDMRDPLRKAGFQNGKLEDLGADAVCRVDLRLYADGIPAYGEELDGVYQTSADWVDLKSPMDAYILMTQDRVLRANIYGIEKEKGEGRKATLMNAEELKQKAGLSSREAESLQLKYLTVTTKGEAGKRRVMKPAWRIERQGEELYFDAETGELI